MNATMERKDEKLEAVKAETGDFNFCECVSPRRKGTLSRLKRKFDHAKLLFVRETRSEQDLG